ncbi:MAG TPA: sigma-70 family RNA polymerase sigma factor [Myxococcaceae bacterium]|jgi:RNA polymerase sigma-70 factor (ECF subfamily)|nr:sigma-70 family RNA polymerase sigma factor [Myxococcaceae bacterium]
MPHPEDVNIVSLAVAQEGSRGRSAEAPPLDALYRAHEGAVYALARRLSGNDAEAEDVLQETFLEAARSWSQYRGDGPVVAWLKRICSTKALMRMRKDRRLDDEAPGDVGGAALPLDARLDLEPALQRLPEVSRAVVWLHDVEGCTHEEIATLMSQTPSFSKSQLARAHARLRGWLKPDEGGLP